MNVKYERISTKKQTFNRQEIQDGNKYDKVFRDIISGTVKFKDRGQAQKLMKLVKEGKIERITFGDVSRMGRNTLDVLTTLQTLKEYDVCVRIINLGIESRVPNRKGEMKHNSTFDLITRILATIYEMERETIRERTYDGIEAYKEKGGIMGRPEGTSDSDKEFLEKPKSKAIIKQFNRDIDLTIREIASITETSVNTVQKVKRIAIKRGILKR